MDRAGAVMRQRSERGPERRPESIPAPIPEREPGAGRGLNEKTGQKEGQREGQKEGQKAGQKAGQETGRKPVKKTDRKAGGETGRKEKGTKESGAKDGRKSSRKPDLKAVPKTAPESRSGSGPKPLPEPAVLPQPPAATPAAATPAPDTPAPVRPPARRARLLWRHWLALLAFLVMVLLPAGVTGWYLWTRAADQYASELAFSIRHEEGGAAAAAGLLGGLAQLTAPAASGDAEIIYQLLHSRDFVAGVDAALDLRAIWSRPGRSWRDGDPVFAFDPDGALEDLRDYWGRMVRVAHDGGSGLITLQVLAFRPEDALAISREILARSEAAINALNAAARADSLRHADEDLELAAARLRAARLALHRFRSRYQSIDPGIDLQLQSGLIGNLQGQLAQAMIEADLLRDSAAPSDPRLAQALRRIAVIEARIAGERRRFGAGDVEAGVEAGGAAEGAAEGVAEGTAEGVAEGVAGTAADEGDFAALVGIYQGLVIDEEFAQQGWLAAMAARDAARAAAARQSRWLAAHVPPSLAESARHPQRAVIALLVVLFALLLWAITLLVAWSLRDRR